MPAPSRPSSEGVRLEALQSSQANLGIAFAQSGRFDEAVQALKAELAPAGSEEARRNLAAGAGRQADPLTA